jgi:phosphoglycerate dehydrogenase-like enzyme
MRMLANEDAQMAPLLAERLRREEPDVELTLVDKEGQPRGPAADAEILFRFNVPNAALTRAMDAAPNLRWVHTGSAGVERFIDLVRAHAPHAVLTNGSGTMAQPIAEFVLAQIFAAAKNLPFFWRAQQQHEWSNRSAPLPHAEVSGSRLLILGLGSIGQSLARMAAGVGMEVWGMRRTPLAPGETVANVSRVMATDADWRGMLPAADYVAVCLPLTPATRHLIGAAELARLRPTAWIINISRGAVINEVALAAALAAGQIGGAALDVTETEPLPPDSPLWDLPNAIITPHVSWRSPEIDRRSLDLFFDNLRRYRAGEPLLNVVPFDVGY